VTGFGGIDFIWFIWIVHRATFPEAGEITIGRFSILAAALDMFVEGIVAHPSRARRKAWVNQVGVCSLK